MCTCGRGGSVHVWVWIELGIFFEMTTDVSGISGGGSGGICGVRVATSLPALFWNQALLPHSRLWVPKESAVDMNANHVVCDIRGGVWTSLLVAISQAKSEQIKHRFYKRIECWQCCFDIGFYVRTPFIHVELCATRKYWLSDANMLMCSLHGWKTRRSSAVP